MYMLFQVLFESSPASFMEGIVDGDRIRYIIFTKFKQPIMKKKKNLVHMINPRMLDNSHLDVIY